MSEYGSPGLAPHYQQSQPYQSQSNGRPAALIWVTVLTVLVILIGATQSTVGALERNHTSMSSEALVQVTIPALVKIVPMDAVTLIALLFLWRRRNWARIVSIILSILGALGGLFSFYGSVILFNSVDVQALSGAELAHFIFVLVLVNLPTVCQAVIAVLLFTPGMRRYTYAAGSY